MGFPSHRVHGLPATLLAVLTLAACQQPPPPVEEREMDWARAALERNPTIEVVSADAAARRFTVRIKASGELATVSLGTIVAGPPESFRATAPEPKLPPTAPEKVASAVAAASTGTSTPAAAAEPAPPQAQPIEAPAGTTMEVPAYSVERSADGVRVTGPGVSIETVGSSRVSGTAAPAGTLRADSPIICEGPRLLRLDGRRLAVPGDAIVARDGCEIHLTNSRVDASRTGIVVQNAQVHVSNSEVIGRYHSLDIGDGGQVYARASEFQGLVQRYGSGRLEDLGGNRFK